MQVMKALSVVAAATIAALSSRTFAEPVFYDLRPRIDLSGGLPGGEDMFTVGGLGVAAAAPQSRDLALLAASLAAVALVIRRSR
jgi:hypothetical protein